MKKYFSDVAKFHKKFKLVGPESLKALEPDLFNFRVNFLYEEYDEYFEASKNNDLATAIDSLIDLIYVAIGTMILHGCTKEQFESIYKNFAFKGLINESSKPVLLSTTVLNHIQPILKSSIDDYAKTHNSITPETSEVKASICLIHLVKVCYSCFLVANFMNVPKSCWLEMWNDVQRANMEKKRVKNIKDSKRSSTYDVVKPAGWIAPNSDGILKKYI